MEQGRERIRRWLRQHEADRVLRWLVVAVVLVAYAVTSASLTQPPTYEASAQVLVDEGSPAQGTGNGKIQLIPNAPTPEALRALTQTMVQAVDSRPVAKEAIRRLELRMDPAELLDNLTVEQIEGTQFIRLSYEDTDPQRAQQVANTVGVVFCEFVSGRSTGDSTLTATVWEKAAVPERPVSPRPLMNGLLTLVGGLVISAALGLPLPRPLAARVPALPRTDPGEAERVKEQELLEALGRCGRLTPTQAALEASLMVEEAQRMLFDLAAQGHLEISVEDSRLVYSFWAHGQ